MSILDSLCEDAPKTDEIGDLVKELMSADWVPPGKRRLIVKACNLLKRLMHESVLESAMQLTEQDEINVDDLKAVGLQVKEQKPNQPLTPNKDDEEEEQNGAIPPSAAIVAPSATPPEEEIPQSVIDATATADEEPGVKALVDALRRVHQNHGKSGKPAVSPDGKELPPEDTTHAESFDEMGAGDYRKLMLEARSKKRS